MNSLDNYTPWEHEFCGHDLAALQAAHKRCRLALASPTVTAWDRDRLQELLTTGSVLKYEDVREAYSEVAGCLPPRLKGTINDDRTTDTV
jgi:hypothetical protein